jgi:ring-1,2-phenylacetyl-CoA epoxidase subunit PaaE
MYAPYEQYVFNTSLACSCQAGMCTTGKVKMDEEDGLTEKQIEDGYVLTCVAHPLTDNVVLDIE